MNKQLQKKLLSYSALATALIAVEKPTDAQIVYTPVNPPDTIYTSKGANYYIDLNNDGINDFYMFFYSHSTSTDNHGDNYALSRWINIGGYGKNEIGVDTANKTNDTICNDNWSRTTQLALYRLDENSTTWNRRVNQSFLGNFFSDTAKYLPLKLIVDTNTYYGWARLRIDSDVSMLILSGYAYDSVPNECIVAGDTGAAITTSIPVIAGTDEISVWAYNKIVHIKLGSNNVVGSKIIIYNVCGQEVYSSQITNQSSTIGLDSFEDGVYIVKIIGKQSTIVKKIVID